MTEDELRPLIALVAVRLSLAEAALATAHAAAKALKTEIRELRPATAEPGDLAGALMAERHGQWLTARRRELTARLAMAEAEADRCRSVLAHVSARKEALDALSREAADHAARAARRRHQTAMQLLETLRPPAERYR